MDNPCKLGVSRCFPKCLCDLSRTESWGLSLGCDGLSWWFFSTWSTVMVAGCASLTLYALSIMSPFLEALQDRNGSVVGVPFHS